MEKFQTGMCVEALERMSVRLLEGRRILIVPGDRFKVKVRGAYAYLCRPRDERGYCFTHEQVAENFEIVQNGGPFAHLNN